MSNSNPTTESARISKSLRRLLAGFAIFMLAATGSPADVLQDPLGNTISRHAVTSGGGGMAQPTITMQGASGQVSGPPSFFPTLEQLFHGIPGPLWEAESPTALFSAIPVSGSAPLMVQFTDASTPVGEITNWDWDFGDSGHADIQNPVHEFLLPGTYTVSLTVTMVGGHTSTCTFTDYIAVNSETPLPVRGGLGLLAVVLLGCGVRLLGRRNATARLVN